MAQRLRFDRDDDTTIEVCITERDDGDFGIDAQVPGLLGRRQAVMPGAWSVARQVHGRTVLDARPGEVGEADAIVTSERDLPIAVQGADCAPIAVITDRGPVAVAHAGWRGLQAGVIDAVLDRLDAEGATVRLAVVGPLIGAECYEFSADDLDRVAGALGDHVRATTREGRPALDLGAGVREAFRRRGVEDVRFVGRCTACGATGFSHRARGEIERHALAIRIISGPDVHA